jgi:hypothetical protein
MIAVEKCPDCMKEYREHKKKWKYGKIARAFWFEFVSLFQRSELAKT